MPWIAPIAGAVIGAVASNRQAKAANKPQTGHTDQTTTQTPYGESMYGPDINNVLQYQRALVARGVPQLGPNGQITYPSQLPWGFEGGDAAFANGNRSGGAGGPVAVTTPGSAARPGSGGSPPPVPPGGSQRPDGRILDAQNRTIWEPPGPAKPKPGKGASKAPKPGPGAGAGAGTAGPAGVDYTDPRSILGEASRRGFEAGNTATQIQGRNAISSILGAAGGAGSAAGAPGGEATGFEGYNPVLADLTRRLQSNANDASARDLLRQFLNENNRGGNGGTAPGSVGAGGRPGGGGRGGGSGYSRDANGVLVSPATGSGPGGSGGSGAGVPDTMAVPSFFGDQTRALFDEQANDAELAALIDSMNQDTERGMFRDMAELDAASQGAGRFGSDMWKGMSRDAREEALQEMNKTASQVRVGDREARRQARLASLGLVNQRDLGLLGASVSREGIAAGERSARYGADASSAAAADQIALARRGQDLGALGDLLGVEQADLSGLGSIGGQLSQDRLAAMSQIPGLEGIGLSGLQIALGGAGGMVDMRGQDVQRQIANANNSIARAQIGMQGRGLDLQERGMNTQDALWNAGQQQQSVDNYLRTLMNIGSMGGTSHTQGVNVQPGMGVSPSGAALTGALGGAAAGYGMYNQYRG